jgi:hypothetical protein
MVAKNATLGPGGCPGMSREQLTSSAEERGFATCKFTSSVDVDNDCLHAAFLAL